MSWFKRRPRTKEQPKQTPQHTSPMTDKLLKESKKKMREDPKITTKS